MRTQIEEPMSNDAILEIRLFGQLSIGMSGATPVEFPPSRVGALLACLALDTRRAHSREEFADLLWPEDDAEEGRHKLRQTLHDLRRQITLSHISPNAVLLTPRSTLQFNPDLVRVDVAEFEACLATAARTSEPANRARCLERAVELYRGDLLPGFYQERFLSEQGRLTEVFHGALRALALAYEEAEEFDRGIEVARRLIALNPLNEEAHCDLMRLFAATGQPASVLSQYRSLERILWEELGEPLGKSTHQLMETLRETGRARVADREIAPVREVGRAEQRKEGARHVPEVGSGTVAEPLVESDQPAADLLEQRSLQGRSRPRWPFVLGIAVLTILALSLIVTLAMRPQSLAGKKPLQLSTPETAANRHAPSS